VTVPAYDDAALLAAGRFVDAAGVRLFVRELGAGAPLLLVHGYGVSHLEYRRVLEALARERRVIAPDLPGHGESAAPARYPYSYAAMADTLAGMLDTLGLGRVALLGHSMGGGVALHLAARYPARVDRLILCDAACYPAPLPSEGRPALWPVLGPLLFRYAYRERDLRRYFVRRVYRDPGALDEALVAYYWSRVKRHRQATYAALRAVASAEGLAALPREVACPTLVLWGQHDRIFPLAHGERLAREIPGASFEVLGGCGHAPAEEQPERFVDAVSRFIA